MTDLPALRDEALRPKTFEEMLRQAEVLVKSGFLPVEIKSPAAAAAIIMAGRELGIPPMHAFRSINVVKGKVSLSAQLMGALILRAGHTYQIIESTNERCEIEFRRRDGTTYRHEFTLADAKRAQLEKGNVWQAYPKALLFSRCMSAGARVAMPDVLAGMYTLEELADPDAVVVDDEGEVVAVVPQQHVPETSEPRHDEPHHDEPPKPSGWETWSERARAAFWARANEMSLSKNVVHAGFALETMKDFQGSMDDAKVVLLALDYGLNKCDIGVAGLLEALGEPVSVAVGRGADFDAIKGLVDAYIAERVAEGETVQRQGELIA